MAADWVEFGKEVLKLAVRARYSFILWFTALLILVAPVPKFLRLERIMEEHGQYIGLVCIVAFIAWVVEVSLIVWERIRKYLSNRRVENEILEHLDSLSPPEAQLLATAVTDGNQTIMYRVDGAEVSSLTAKKLLLVVPDISPMRRKPFTVPRFVWKRITMPAELAKLVARSKVNVRIP